MSRVLIWSPNYAPELTGIPPLVTDVSEWMAARGHRVSVVTALPNYPHRRIFSEYRNRLIHTETIHDVHVHRSWIRVRPGETFLDKALYELSFSALSAPAALGKIRRIDIIVCVVPTILTSVLASLAPRADGRRFVVWVQDLVLLAAQAIDRLSAPQRAMLTLMQRVERVSLRRADTIVTCSPGFTKYLCARGANARSIITIPNWVDTTEITHFDHPDDDMPVRFLYTGNIGYTQAFDTLVAATRLVGGGVQLEIVGGGNAVDRTRRLLEGVGVVRQAVQRQAYPALLGSAHVLVLVQRQVAANANLPSKIASYLAAGRPIVASIDLNTPAAQLLRESGGAIIVPPENPSALATAMGALRDDRELRETLGKNGRRYAEEHLARERILDQLERAFLGE